MDVILRSLFFLAMSAPIAALAQQPAADSQVDILIPDGSWTVPKELTFRARVTAISPAEKVDIAWRHNGEGLGGNVFRGKVGEKLDLGEWSPPVEVVSLVPNGKFPRTLFLTITVGRGGKYETVSGADGVSRRELIGASRDVEIEFEFHDRDKLVKRFAEKGPFGGTIGLVIPASRLSGGRTPEDPTFLRELGGLLSYARRRAERVAALPWAEEPLPKKYAIQTDLGGYGEGVYYGIRTTDRDVIAAEIRTLRQLGVNGLRNAPPFVLDLAARDEGYGQELRRLRDTHGMGFPVAKFDARKKDVDPEAGCPFAAGVPERTKQAVEEVLATTPKTGAEEVWSLTVDEIGSVFDGTPEGKRHLAICPRCAEAFRAYLQQQGLKPADFGVAAWEDVSPFDSYAKDFKLEAADRTTGLRAYHTGMFANYATAKLFTPLRDTLAARNREGQQPRIYSYALRGNTFLMGGHSLDFFDFYRHADNGFVYETSNREPRIWQWDSYLCDVGRVVSAERELRFGVYVKPHRGAPIQRALSAISRNAKMLYWYTYGPDWAKGDTFAGDQAALAACSQAARLIAAGEDVLYGSSPAIPAEVAVVFPRSSELWMRLSGSPPERTAAYENAKWIYTALAHEHLPVDPLDEGMLAEKSLKELARYKVIYVSGPNLTVAAAEKLQSWVHAGGTLYTSGGGLQFDEANQPLTALQAALGLKERRDCEMWTRVALYGATALESFDEKARQIAPAPEAANVSLNAPAKAELGPIIGREVLIPAEGTETLARFADGGAALTRHKHGAGVVWTVGLFPGLEYSVPLRTARYDMTRDLSRTRRQFVTLPCRDVVRPIVACDDPAVEGLLLKNDTTGKLAVTLMNWNYRVVDPPAGLKGAKPIVEHMPRENLALRIRGADKITRVRSAATGATIAASEADGELTLVLPRLDEGDVLLLE